MNSSVYHSGLASSRLDDEVQTDINSAGTTSMAPATLGERIELLDGETRSCWKRFDILEEEEISLTDELARLEKIRRGERMEILKLEQACKATEVITLKAQEEAADHDAESQALEGLALDANEEAAAVAAAATTTVSRVEQDSLSDGRDDGDPTSSRRIKGSAALVAALSKVPPHEEKRRQLTSLLKNIENQTRSDIAEAARSAAELRLSARKRDAMSMPLERETAALRNKLANMASGDEVHARMVRARQAGEGVHRRLEHANNKLDSVREALAQGAARHLEEAEQESLALMQSIAEVKARTRKREGVYGDGSRTPRYPAREGRPSTPTTRLQMHSSSNDGRKGTRYKDHRAQPSRQERRMGVM